MNNKSKKAELTAGVSSEVQAILDKEKAFIEEMRQSLIKVFGDKFTQWEKEFAPRKLFVIEVEDKMALLKPITADNVAAYSMMLVNPEQGMVTATRYLLEEMWLDGDNELRDDEDYFIPTMMQLQNVMEQKKSRFIKL